MSKGIKAYKVVGKDRESALAVGKYQIRYPRGRMVRAPTGTLGIMCFLSLCDANNWRAVYGSSVIKVEGYKRRRFRFMASAMNRGLFDVVRVDGFYKGRNRKSKYINRKCNLLDGTILFDKVKVLT